MADVTSLGVHTPTGLPYLIAEGLLPAEPKKELYHWQTYAFSEPEGIVEEEIVATKDCVVWSQNGSVRTVYRFGLEGEDVQQALLTRFPKETGQLHTSKLDVKKPTESFGKSSRRSIVPSLVTKPWEDRGDSKNPAGETSRALVVLLKTKSHIYYLSGSHHIVDLPFEVESAFASPRGLVLQRKINPKAPSHHSSPEYPRAPHNSFFSSQAQPSFQLSPTFAKSFAGSQPARPSPLGANGGTNDWLNGLFSTVCGRPDQSDEREAPRLYSLTSPFSEVGVITESLQQAKPRISGKGSPGVTVEFDSLDTAEQVVYVSSTDELPKHRHRARGQLMLIVTINQDMRLVTVWHGWYIDEQSLASLIKRRAEHKADKARRRSSFLSGSVGPGASTPGARHRDAGRESFAPGASLHVPGELTTKRLTRSASRKTKQQDEEAAMASQMDPDFHPAGSQQPRRESRRISSLVSRGELSTADARSQVGLNASFGAGASRRHTSFGPQNERRSFGPRRSRGSTPGSIFSRSIGLDDDTMDLDDGVGNGGESVESILRHVRNTYDAAGLDNVFGSLDEGTKNELILRKIHSFSIGPQPFPESPSKAGLTVKVATLCENVPSLTTDDLRLTVYVHDQSSQDVLSLSLEIKDRTFWPDSVNSPRASIPIVIGTDTFSGCKDMSKLRDGSSGGLLLTGLGVLLSPLTTTCCPLPTHSPYRNSNPFEVLPGTQAVDTEVGRNRLLARPSDGMTLNNPGAYNTVDEVSTEGVIHRRQIKLGPQNPFIVDVIDTCRLVLPISTSHLIRSTWCKVYAAVIDKPAYLSGTKADPEWVALAAAILFFGVNLLDAKARASLQMSKVAATSGTPTKLKSSSQQHRHPSPLLTQPAWSWMARRQNLAVQSPESKPTMQQDHLLQIAAFLADDVAQSLSPETIESFQDVNSMDSARRLMLGLHILREEKKLDALSVEAAETLAPVIAQLGRWLGREAWDSHVGGFYALEGADETSWAYVKCQASVSVSIGLMDEPVGVYEWLEHNIKYGSSGPYPTVLTVAQLESDAQPSKTFAEVSAKMTPRTTMLSRIFEETLGLRTSSTTIVETAAKHQLTTDILETLPESISAPFRDAISKCEKEPPTTWPSALLRLIGREDLDIGKDYTTGRKPFGQMSAVLPLTKDVQSITHLLESPLHAIKTREADRHAISQLLFSEDRRLIEATSLMHFNNVQVAECPKQPDWSDAYHFEQQRKVMQWVTTRMIALPAGDGMIHFDSQIPLMTEKYHLPGFNSSAIMQPMGHTVTTDRSGLTEEKVNWAYFHAGVSVGLRISRNAKGIDTSWLVFNKPADLTNRHAGLLLALGLNGHLRSLAKWLSFKYLTPKHTMTSVGLLLGISASYLGTMDSLITRMLSVHITAMLPPGAAELNVSSTTQTAGLMGIGLLYCNTEHRRMSELMLHEVELMEVEDVDNGPDVLRDESYRLAAGFALGFINLGKGRDLRGLHGMHLPERLLNVAVGSRPVHAVHVFDKATAGAVIAIALVYMKSGDRTIARKIDIPDTETQFDHVRPDMLMLRTMAKHIILWEGISASTRLTGIEVTWIYANMPACYKSKLISMASSNRSRAQLSSLDVPFYNIATGLAWALSLKYAGSGSEDARNEILLLLDYFHSTKSRGDAYYYDAKLARASLRRCIDVLALAAATVMAGTGDLETFRYLRRQHGRTDAETPYGSHLAAHLAIGVLFLGGGTYTLGTSDMAVASMIGAFYPLFPTDVHDNRVHLQAFRHFWIFAAEARCVIIEDINTRRPIPMSILLTLRDGSTKRMQAPCLLPDLESISTLQTDDPAFWRVTLDFELNPAHLAAFRKNQRIHVRRCPAGEAHSSVFGAALAARSTQSSSTINRHQVWDWVFSLPALREELTKADIELIIPPDVHSSVHTDERATVIDDRLVLSDSMQSGERGELWNLRLLFAWAEKAREEGDEKQRWIGNEVVEALKAGIEARTRGGEPERVGT